MCWDARLVHGLICERADGGTGGLCPRNNEAKAGLIWAGYKDKSSAGGLKSLSEGPGLRFKTCRD